MYEPKATFINVILELNDGSEMFEFHKVPGMMAAMKLAEHKLSLGRYKECIITKQVGKSPITVLRPDII